MNGDTCTINWVLPVRDILYIQYTLEFLSLHIVQDVLCESSMECCDRDTYREEV